eukprot:gb/GECH01012975.1/.p1 GENE.gb/GECH01012975.1/~~gb/GECH01012975.1/.p1  ORF type:complete len:295 (+),score=80.00 gb/GECH01012975.1/:1-885(+)
MICRKPNTISASSRVSLRKFSDFVVDPIDEKTISNLTPYQHDALELDNNAPISHQFKFGDLVLPDPPFNISPPSALQEYKATKFFTQSNISVLRKVSKWEELPEISPKICELAFAGRSNAGKSSLLNAILERKLFSTSKKPGHTRTLDFYDISGEVRIVDLPGYGFAQGKKALIKQWQETMLDYIANRSSLRRVFILIDGRVGMDAKDKSLSNQLSKFAVMHQFVVTKADRLKPQQLLSLVTQLNQHVEKTHGTYPLVLATSAITRENLPLLRAQMYAASGIAEKTLAKEMRQE